MFLITGITGRVGGTAAKHVLAAGKQVRAIVRNPDKAKSWAEQGVELIEGEWQDAAVLMQALQGVEAAYLMMNPVMTPSPGYPEAHALANAYAQALGTAPQLKVVALSSIGSEQPHGLGLITSTHIMEEAMKSHPGPLAFVRAGSFLENYLYGLQSGQGGVLPSMYLPTSHEVPMIGTEDIGAEVAKLLTTSWTGHRTIELGSPLSPDGLASALSEVLGREVKAVPVPPSGRAAMFEGMGLPKDKSGPYEEMIEGINSGWIHFGVPGTEHVAATTTAKQVFAKAQSK